MDVGVTATRDGLSKPQLIRIAGLLVSNVTSDKHGKRLHHGDCIGGDDEIAELAYRIGYENIGHPPINVSKRAFNAYTHVWREAKEYHPRNHDIVDESTFLIGAPKDYSPEANSGTWATIRYAQSQKKMIYVALPDGSILLDWGRGGGLVWEGVYA